MCSANVDMQTCSGNTALHYSCLHNKSDCVRLLLRARANTQISKDHCGHTHTYAHTKTIGCDCVIFGDEEKTATSGGYILD